jgi:hypothetical protein
VKSLKVVVAEAKAELQLLIAAAAGSERLSEPKVFSLRSRHTGRYVVGCYRAELLLAGISQGPHKLTFGLNSRVEHLALTFVGTRAQCEVVQFVLDRLASNVASGTNFEIVEAPVGACPLDDYYTLRIKGGIEVAIGVRNGRHFCATDLKAEQREAVESQRRRHAEWRHYDFTPCEFVGAH